MKSQTSLTTPIYSLLVSAISDLLIHKDSKYYHLGDLFFTSSWCSLQRFERVVEEFSLDIEEEIESATDKTINLVLDTNNLWESIGLPIKMEDLLECHVSLATYELLGATGKRVRFWDSYKLQDFGLTQLPPLVKTEPFYEEAVSILEKLRAAKRKVFFAEFSDMRKSA